MRDKGFEPVINHIESIRNWEYEDTRTHAIQGALADPLATLLDEGRIIWIQGEAKLNKFVVSLSKSVEIYETSISIDTRHLDYLDDALNERNRPVYDELSNLLLSSEIANDLLVAALGVEVMVDYDTDTNKMMLHSHNVEKWLFNTPKEAPIMSLSRQELIALVTKIVNAEGTEEELDQWLEMVMRQVPHPQVSNLIFWHEPELTPEEIVDTALSYQPIVLPPPAES
ncbi:bacteriocin immunity protein [Paenibacillus piscarius]|uniref:bacteriocin immunity protein n=1 Tax=Paenibacillus piscarius TaxID=1089681 RepID=UPI0030844006